MSTKSTRQDDKNKKIIGATIAGATVLGIAGCFGTYHFVSDDNARDNVVNTAKDFKPVSLPDDSKELTEVPEAPVGKLDSSDSAYINVDMQGKKIKEDGQPTHTKHKGKGTHKNTPKTTQKNPTAEDMKQVSNIGKRFKAPSVGLDVPLGAMNEVNGMVRPTNFTNAFTIRNKGIGEDLKKSDKGTLYVAMHATDVGAIAPGNFLVDNDTRSNRLQEGDTVDVGGQKYKITEYRREGKDVIAQDKEVWNDKIKGKLIILTCFPNSTDNALFIGELI